MRIGRVPPAPAQRRRRPRRVLNEAAVLIAVQALAVNAHRGGDDQPLDRPLDQRLQEDGRAEIVDPDVVGHVVHALADADPGRQMDDRIDAGQRALDRARVPDIARHALDLGVQIRGPGAPLPMDLGIQNVEDPHPVALPEQLIAEMRSDEARAARNQHTSGHVRLLAPIRL